MNVVEFMERYNKNIESYNNYGLEKGQAAKTKDEKEKEFLKWDGRRDD